MRVRTVAHLANDTNTICYLATVEKSISGGVDDGGYDRYRGSHRYYDYDDDESDGDIHTIVDEYNREVKLSRLVDLDGAQKLRDISIDESDFLYDDMFDDDPDDEDYTGFTGNAGAEATHWYRRTVSYLNSSRKLAVLITF